MRGEVYVYVYEHKFEFFSREKKKSLEVEKRALLQEAKRDAHKFDDDDDDDDDDESRVSNSGGGLQDNHNLSWRDLDKDEGSEDCLYSILLGW